MSGYEWPPVLRDRVETALGEPIGDRSVIDVIGLLCANIEARDEDYLAGRHVSREELIDEGLIARTPAERGQDRGWPL